MVPMFHVSTLDMIWLLSHLRAPKQHLVVTKACEIGINKSLF